MVTQLLCQDPTAIHSQAFFFFFSSVWGCTRAIVSTFFRVRIQQKQVNSSPVLCQGRRTVSSFLVRHEQICMELISPALARYRPFGLDFSTCWFSQPVECVFLFLFLPMYSQLSPCFCQWNVIPWFAFTKWHVSVNHFSSSWIVF